MADIPQILARLKRDPIADLPIAQRVDQLMQSSGVQWRQRLLPPPVTLRLLLIQILQGNGAIAALRQLCSLDFALSSYCEARIRLLLILLESLLRWVHEHAHAAQDQLTIEAELRFIDDGVSGAKNART
jgi:hypothetical protein